MRLLVIAVLSAALLTSVTGRAAAADRPNFVIMMTDDQRWDAMSCAGNSILRTPNMDRIAAQGMRFRNAFVTNALCAPSRATLLTGLYSHSHGVIDNNNRRIAAEQKLLSDLLREVGYEVAFCGKSHIGGSLRDRPWDFYFGFQGQGRYLKPMIAEGADGKDIEHDGYMDDVVTGRATEWLKGRGSRPFCLFLFSRRLIGAGFAHHDTPSCIRTFRFQSPTRGTRTRPGSASRGRLCKPIIA